MTDLPKDDSTAQLRCRAFNELVALKTHNQAQKLSDLKDWKIWYASLSDDERARVDEHLSARCDEIAAQFGQSRRFVPKPPDGH